LVLSGAYALYPLVTKNFPAEYAARASSALNFLVSLRLRHSMAHWIDHRVFPGNGPRGIRAGCL
ncbi:MAG: hypothetical protein ACPGQV_23850, partial [Alphaproteobacteria bacterium]